MGQFKPMALKLQKHIKSLEDQAPKLEALKIKFENQSNQMVIEKRKFQDKQEELERSREDLQTKERKLKTKYLAKVKFYNDFLSRMKGHGEANITLPHLIRWANFIQRQKDEAIPKQLLNKRNPARKAAEDVRDANRSARKANRKMEVLRTHMELYERYAPWLSEVCDYSVSDIIEGLEAEAKLAERTSDTGDPVEVFVPTAQWGDMSISERNQLALYRYWDYSRKMSSWSVGIQYERYIGWLYENRKYQVEYHGANKGVNDLGIDLLRSNGSELHVVQCKRLSVVKGMPVRENTIAQTYGAAKFTEKDVPDGIDVVPVVYTSFEVSDTARAFADYLGVRLFEHIALEGYPSIKCNRSSASGEKIYHLPFDQQYDTCKIEPQKGDFYTETVAEAESAGFRRAYRWNGIVG